MQSPALGTEGRGKTGRRLPGSQILTGVIKYGLLQQSLPLPLPASFSFFPLWNAYFVPGPASFS